MVTSVCTVLNLVFGYRRGQHFLNETLFRGEAIKSGQKILEDYSNTFILGALMSPRLFNASMLFEFEISQNSKVGLYKCSNDCAYFYVVGDCTEVNVVDDVCPYNPRG